MNALLNKRFHACLSEHGLLEMKADLVYQFTGGRTSSSREMYDDEAREMIGRIVSGHSGKCDRLRKTLIAMCQNIGEPIDFVRHWCEKQGVRSEAGELVKKKFNDYTAAELMELIKRFEKVVAHRQAAVREKV